MAYESIHVGDYGHTFKLTVQEDGTALDISGFATRQMLITDPSGNATLVAATFETDGTDGVLQCTTTTGLIDEAGVWRIQARVSESGTAQHTSDPLEFMVAP